MEINGNTLLNDPQDHLVGGKLFPIAILLMNVTEDMEGVHGQRKLAYFYFLEYHFFLEYAGFPEAVLTFGFWETFHVFCLPLGGGSLSIWVWSLSCWLRPSPSGGSFYLVPKLFGVFPLSPRISYVPPCDHQTTGLLTPLVW